MENRKQKYTRRSFLKTGALLSTSVAASTVAGKPIINTEATASKQKVKYRPSRKNRYPWWVKSVDKMTTETDDSITVRPGPNVVLVSIFTELETVLEQQLTGIDYAIKNIKNNVPGSSLKDFALHYAAGSFFREGIGWIGMAYGQNMLVESASINIHPPQELGVPPWTGSPEEASDMLEAAGIQLGSAQVAFTKVNPLWLPDFVKFEKKAKKVIQKTELDTELGATFNKYVRKKPLRDEIPKIKADIDKLKEKILNHPELLEIIVPDSYKYVVVGSVPRPYDLTIRAGSELGATGDRVGYEGKFLARQRMINFIKGLGYDAISIPSYNPIPWAVASGLGEMGRQNRLVSPTD